MRRVKIKESTAQSIPIRLDTISPTDQVGIVRLTHSQSIKQSIDYQSADAQYSIGIFCPDNPKEIRKTFKRAERILEKFLVEKVNQQQTLLRELGKQNR